MDSILYALKRNVVVKFIGWRYPSRPAGRGGGGRSGNGCSARLLARRLVVAPAEELDVVD